MISKRYKDFRKNQKPCTVVAGGKTMAEHTVPAPMGISPGIECDYHITGRPSFKEPPIPVAALSERCAYLLTGNGRHFVPASS
jgi:hypothetical protein